MRYTIEQDEENGLFFLFDCENEEAMPNYYDTLNEANIKILYLNELEEQKSST
jgi:predicted 3-demethylubiquinone-9 3-methyltransferase (glyoxalase superfamily)